jgi:hypothetical protein
MVRTFVAAVAVVLLPAVTCANDGERAHDHHKTETSPATEPAINIIINPEARLSVVLGASFPAPAPCGTATEMTVKIVNQGFLTSQLEAQMVGEAPAGVTIEFRPEPLKGVPEEVRKLSIVVSKPGPTDLTIAFRPQVEFLDLGGRNQIHFLIHCLQPH